MSGKVTETSTDLLYAAYPHLQKIDLLWGSPECRIFVFNLLTDTRGGSRQGFPKAHAATLMLLLHEHDQHFPQFEHCASFETAHHWGRDSHRRGGRF